MWLDLKNAFGSVRHELLIHSLRLAHIPDHIINYVERFYQNIRVCKKTTNFVTKAINLKVGVFQGDTLSPVLFLMAINPILQTIQQASHTGYDFRGRQVIQLAFADDLTLCFKNKKTAQRQLTDINNTFDSVGLTLKPQKCKSLSICSGKVTDISFKLRDEQINNIQNTHFKFLGTYIFSHRQRSQATNLLNGDLKKYLRKVDDLPIRGSYKIKIYSLYVTSMLRFPLMVQDLSTSGLSNLDKVTTKFIRKWTKIPHSTTTGLLRHKNGMNLQLPSDLYDCGHLGIESNPSDNTVKDAIAEKVEHPQAIRSTYREHVRGTNHTANRESLEQERNNELERHAANQVSQGQWADLLDLKAKETSFKSLLNGLSEATFRWLHKASTDTLPCGSYLKRINRITDNACHLCGHKPESLKHVLNSCQFSLRNGRYGWRHDSVLQYLRDALQAHVGNSQNTTITADLPNMYSGGAAQSVNTIPEDVLLTEQRPDITLIDREARNITLIELSICWDQDNAQARARKENRYEPLISEIIERRWKANLITLEIGSRGFSGNSTANALKKLLPSKRIRGSTLTKLNQIAINCSHKIFQERSNELWIPLSLMS